jgi:hypothetical protein
VFDKRRQKIGKNKTVPEILFRAVGMIDYFLAEFAGMRNDRVTVDTAGIDMQNIVVFIPRVSRIFNAL